MNIFLYFISYKSFEIYYKKAMKICGRNGVKNISMIVICIKILFMGLYFDYPISKVVDEINRSNRLKKFLNINGKVPEVAQVL